MKNGVLFKKMQLEYRDIFRERKDIFVDQLNMLFDIASANATS